MAAPEPPSPPPSLDPPAMVAARHLMVERQIERRGVRDARVLAAMREVPRHRFVPAHHHDLAYDDTPLPLGWGQTISQPYIVAAMLELARIAPGDNVLEVGTGSGYQTALLSALGADVYSIEIVAGLAASAAERLKDLGYRARVRRGDGRAGWPEAAPFDAIVVAAAAADVPAALVDQLAVGGRLVVPVGDLEQELHVVTRTALGDEDEVMGPVLFVPLTEA